jgi:hypothetical protein
MPIEHDQRCRLVDQATLGGTRSATKIGTQRRSLDQALSFLTLGSLDRRSATKRIATLTRLERIFALRLGLLDGLPDGLL